MRWRSSGVGAVALTVLLAAPPQPAPGQVVEAAAALADGTLTLSYPVRPSVRICSDGAARNTLRRGARMVWDGTAGHGLDGCREGTAVAEISVVAGQVRSVTFLAPGYPPANDAVDLGRLTGPAAADAWATVARSGSPATEDAILGMALADSALIWPELLALADDARLETSARRSALFWLGQEAADAVTAALEDRAGDPSEGTSIRDAAVFALSRRPAAEAVPALKRLALHAPHAETRRSALFWLAQSGDASVPDFLAGILRSPFGRRMHR